MDEGAEDCKHADIEEEEEEKSNIPLTNYETNDISPTAAVTVAVADDESVQKNEDKSHNIAPPPIDYAVDRDTSSSTRSISEQYERDPLPILPSLDDIGQSINSSVRIIRRNNSSYKELSHSHSDHMPSSPVERMETDDKSVQINDDNANCLDIITPQQPPPSSSQPIAIPIVSSSDEENAQQKEESVSRNTQIIRNDKSRKERSNSFGPGSMLLYGEMHDDDDECQYEEEGSAFLEHSYDGGVSNKYYRDRNIKLSRRRARNNKKISNKLKHSQYHYSDREYSINSEFDNIESLLKMREEYKKMHKLSLCGDDDNDDNSSLSVSNRSDCESERNEHKNKNRLKLRKVSQSVRLQQKKKRIKTKSRKSLQSSALKQVKNKIDESFKEKMKKKKNKRMIIPKRVRPHSQSVDIPKSKFKIDDSAKKNVKSHKKKRRKKEKKSLELNKEQTKAIRSSKKRNRAQSVKSKKHKSKIRDIDVCKDKVKNSIFRREKGHKDSFQDVVDDIILTKEELPEWMEFDTLYCFTYKSEKY